MTNYKLKEIRHDSRNVRIILQNENGPCPLLAIANILLLRNAIHLQETIYEISEQDLLTIIAGYIIDNNPINESSQYSADLRKNINVSL